MWRYSVSHAQLLLAAPRSEEAPSRLSVLFKTVEHIDCPTSFDCRELRIPDKLGPDARDFELAGDGRVHRVRAGAVFWEEDELEYWAPSPFAASFGEVP